MKLETEILKKGYDPQLSEGSLVTPIFNSSTYVFKKAEDGERSFQIAYGLDTKKENEDPCLIYSRVNNPNMQILEEKLALLDSAESSLIFSSGMASISNTCFTFLSPGDIMLFSNPVYGGSEYLFNILLPSKGVKCVPFPCGSSYDEILNYIKDLDVSKIKLIFVETPCNPLLKLTSLKVINKVKSFLNNNIITIVDNTFTGPYYLEPIKLGCDLVVYSVTKFIGGHSDLIAGSVSGSNNLINHIRVTRTIMGSIPDPNTCWLIQRSLYTLKLRMDKQTENTKDVINFLKSHDKVDKIYYPGLEQKEIFDSEYNNSGSVFSFDIKGGKNAAFKMLNECKVFFLAVSLGGVESLIQHPSTMTHSDMTQEEQTESGINGSLIRCSVGLESSIDLIDDLKQALEKV